MKIRQDSVGQVSNFTNYIETDNKYKSLEDKHFLQHFIGKQEFPAPYFKPSEIKGGRN